MSRQIDLSKPLNDDDRYYLETRGRDDLIAANDRNFAEVAKVDDGNTGDIDQHNADNGLDVVSNFHPGEVTTTPVQAVAVGQAHEVPRVPVHQANDARDGEDPGISADADADEDPSDNYDDKEAWSYDDLKVEVGERKEALEDTYDGPALNASREDLISWLRKDDERE